MSSMFRIVQVGKPIERRECQIEVTVSENNICCGFNYNNPTNDFSFTLNFGQHNGFWGDSLNVFYDFDEPNNRNWCYYTPDGERYSDNCLTIISGQDNFLSIMPLSCNVGIVPPYDELTNYSIFINNIS